MFGREFTGKGHRQHVLPPNPTSYSFEKVGSTREALGLSGLSVGDEVYWYGGGDDVDTSSSGIIVEIPAVDPDGRTRSDMAAVEWADDGYEIVEINNLLNAEHYNIGRGYSQAFGARKQASSLTWEHETAEQSMLGEEIWFAYSGDGFNASVSEESPGSGRFMADIFTDSDLYEYLSTTEYGFESVDEAKSFVEGVFGYSRVASRTAGKCPKCDGMGRETYETNTGSLSTQTCKACEGTGQAKESARRTAQWFTNTDRMGDSYKTTFDPSRGNEFQSDEPVARVSERPRSDDKPSKWAWEVWLPGGHPMGSGGVAPAVPEFGNEETEEEALRKAEQAMSRYAFRKASHRTAFLDTIEFKAPRHRVAGWDWDDHLNGFLAAEAAREFTCSCGANVPAPGYTDCRCGKRWNVYSVQSPQGQKLISREVPVRENVVMATRAMEAGVSLHDDGMAPDTGTPSLRDHPRRQGSVDTSNYHEDRREKLSAQGSGAETGDLWSNLTTAGVHGNVARGGQVEDDSLSAHGDVRRPTRGSARSASQRRPDGQSPGELGLRRDRHAEHAGYGRAASAVAAEEGALSQGSPTGAAQPRRLTTGPRVERLSRLQEGSGPSEVLDGAGHEGSVGRGVHEADTIQANGSKKMIAREVPVRDGVVMANRRTAAGTGWETPPVDLGTLSDEELREFVFNVQHAIDSGANIGTIMENKKSHFRDELVRRGWRVDGMGYPYKE